MLFSQLILSLVVSGGNNLLLITIKCLSRLPSIDSILNHFPVGDWFKNYIVWSLFQTLSGSTFLLPDPIIRLVLRDIDLWLLASRIIFRGKFFSKFFSEEF